MGVHQEVPLLAQPPLKSPGASALRTTLPLVNNIVGAGFVSLAFTLRQTSLFSGLCLMTFMCAMSGVSAVMIAAACERTGCFKYVDLGQAIFGPAFGVVVQIAMATYALGSCISYVVLVGDFIPNVVKSIGLQSSVLSDRVVVTWVCAMVLFLPFSLRPRLTSMSWTSALGVIGLLYCTLLVVTTDVEARAGGNEGAGEIMFGAPWTGVMVALPVLSVAFTSHYNVPRYYYELGNRSVAKFATVVAAAFSVVLAVYTVTAACGYDTYGQYTMGNLLMNFSDGPATVVARLSLGLITVVVYPLALHFIRGSFSALLNFDPDIMPFWTARLPTTLALVVATVVVGIKVPRIEVVLAYKGALAGSFCVYVFPGMMHWKLNPGVSGACGLMLVVFGMSLCVLGTYCTTIQLLQ